MPTMIRNVKGSELPSYLLQQAKISPNCFITITLEEEEKPRDLKQELREALQEAKDYEAGKIDLCDARDVLNSLGESFNV